MAVGSWSHPLVGFLVIINHSDVSQHWSDALARFKSIADVVDSQTWGGVFPTLQVQFTLKCAIFSFKFCSDFVPLNSVEIFTSTGLLYRCCVSICTPVNVNAPQLSEGTVVVKVADITWVR